MKRRFNFDEVFEIWNDIPDDNQSETDISDSDNQDDEIHIGDNEIPIGDDEIPIGDDEIPIGDENDASKINVESDMPVKSNNSKSKATTAS